MENYHPYKGTTGTTSKSGTGLYIHKDLNLLPRTDPGFKVFKEEEEFESWWIEIVNDQSPNVLIRSIYRHPSGNDKLFIKDLRNTFSALHKEKIKIIALVGDFNGDLLKYGTDNKIENFLITMEAIFTILGNVLVNMDISHYAKNIFSTIIQSRVIQLII